MTFTPEQMTKAKAAKAADELIAMAKAENVEMTADEAAKYFAALNGEGTLTDSELAAIAGGGKGDLHDEYPSRSCFYSVSGNKCPICGEEMTYTGEVSVADNCHEVYLCGNSGNSFRLVYNNISTTAYWQKV